MVVENPYKQEQISDNKFIRTFDKNVLTEELVWHRDRKDREIKVLVGEGWELQIDNCLPIPLIAESVYYISAGTYHRIKRGTTDLVVEINEDI